MLFAVTNTILLAANDNQYCTATSLSGPWSAWTDFAPSGTNTYKSQTNYVLGVGNTVVYVKLTRSICKIC
jgi:hypothetical protein